MSNLGKYIILYNRTGDLNGEINSDTVKLGDIQIVD